MIAPIDIPGSFEEWNKRWSAPNGRALQWPEWLQNTSVGLRRKGPFAWQINNGTRAFEYPWAYRTITDRGHGLSIVEIGGGLSGLQFVLASEGHHVVNIDPGQTEQNWTYDRRRHARLCEAFHAPVMLVETTIGKAKIPDASADVLISISALEHFPDEALTEFCRHAARILKPDGIGVLSVDLFLDANPFCSRTSNQFGRNIDVHQLLQDASLRLESGNRAELMGFPEFTVPRVMENLGRYLRGFHPALAQCFTVRRAA